MFSSFFDSILCNTMMSKNPEGSTFYIFWHCDTVQKSNFHKNRKFLKSLKGPFQLFQILHVEFHKTQSPLSFYNFRKSADFGRSRFVYHLICTINYFHGWVKSRCAVLYFIVSLFASFKIIFETECAASI